MLDKQLDFILKFSRGQDLKKVHELEIGEARKNVSNFALSMGLEPIDLPKVEDIFVKRPDGSLLQTRFYFSDLMDKKPIFIFFHGGGYALYDIDTHDSLCRYFSKHLNCNIVSVNYHRAPEYTYPAAYDDALLGAEWVLKNIDLINGDADKVIIGGDSVGSELAMLVNNTLYKKYKIRLLFLLYPVFNFNKHYESYQKYGEHYFLDTDTMDWFVDMYFHGTPKENNLDIASFLKNNITTYMAISEYDVLKDSAIEYVHYLKDNKAKVDYRTFESLPHNFALMAGKIKGATKALETICEDLNKIILKF